MSKKIENHCVDCGLPCLGTSCVYYNVLVYYCDYCKTEVAEYRMGSEDLCKDCINEIIKEKFDALTLFEKAEVIGVDLRRINGT